MELAERPPILAAQARNRRFTLMAASLAVAVVVIAVGAVAFWPTSPDLPPTASQSTTTTASLDSTAPQETSTTPATTTTVDPSTGDSARTRAAETVAASSVVDAFVEFARNPSGLVFSSLPLADSVALGLGQEVVGSVDADQLRDPEAWMLEVEEFRAYTGPFSPLSLLESLDEYTVQVGEHPHCAGPPQPPPAGLKNHKRFSVQPLAESLDSCLSWLTVDFFVGTSGEVVAITMDLWEP